MRPLTLLLSTSLFMYIGPPLVAGTIGTIVGIILSVLLALLAIFWYPIKRFYKKTFGKGKDAKENDPKATQAESQDKPDSDK